MTNIIFYSIIIALLIILLITHIRDVKYKNSVANEILKRENEILEFQRNIHLLKMLKLSFRMAHTMDVKYNDGTNDAMLSDIHLYKIVDIKCEVDDENNVKMVLDLARPGILIGKGGRNIDLLKKTMLDILKDYDIVFNDLQIVANEVK